MGVHWPFEAALTDIDLKKIKFLMNKSKCEHKVLGCPESSCRKRFKFNKWN